jgi:hypothetical protein
MMSVGTPLDASPKDKDAATRKGSMDVEFLN